MVSFLDRVKTLKGSPNLKEQGNTLILYIMLFPVVFSAFGLAIDTTLATYTQTSLQSNLDAATQSALSRAANPTTNSTNTTNRPKLSAADARTNIINIYATNRTGSGEQPFVICQKTPARDGSITGSLVKGTDNCAWTQTYYSYTDRVGNISVKMSVLETSKPIFLQLLNIDEFKYNLTSEAKLTYAQG